MISPVYWIEANELYAPAALGRKQLLIAAGKILAIGDDLQMAAQALNASPIIHAGKVIPGLIDQHIHYTGGGDGDGPLARMPELSLEEIASAGITTSVGLLGSETEAKNLSQLLRKAHELQRQGLTTFIYSGAMPLPAPFLTQSVRSDLALIEKCIGAKSAIAERVYPNLDFAALAALAGELVLARAMTGKACVLHLHVGRMATGLQSLLRLIDEMDFPIDMAVPTHINRVPQTSPVFAQGLDFARAGGTIDFTACLGPLDGIPTGIDAVAALCRATDEGVALSQLTLSSDAGVAVPDGQGGVRRVMPSILFRDVRRLVHQAGWRWSEALQPVTTNVARVLRLSDSKGQIAPGYDADFVFLNQDDEPVQVWSRGRCLFDVQSHH